MDEQHYLSAHFGKSCARENKKTACMYKLSLLSNAFKLLQIILT